MRSCLIADDHALMRGALAGLVGGRWPDAAIVEAENFASARAIAPTLQAPAIAIVDLDMPGAAPLEGIAQLRDAAPGLPLLVVTGLADDAMMRALLAAGVGGFASKTESPQILLAAIDLVVNGGRYLPPRVAALLIEADVGQGPRLTARQEDVVRLVAEGRSNKEIAQALGLSPATVKTHVAQAMAAIGAANRTDAAVKARAAGLV